MFALVCRSVTNIEDFFGKLFSFFRILFYTKKIQIEKRRESIFKQEGDKMFKFTTTTAEIQNKRKNFRKAKSSLENLHINGR